MEFSALVTQTSFSERSSGDLAKRRLFSQARCLSAKIRRSRCPFLLAISLFMFRVLVLGDNSF